MLNVSKEHVQGFTWCSLTPILYELTNTSALSLFYISIPTIITY